MNTLHIIRYVPQFHVTKQETYIRTIQVLQYVPFRSKISGLVKIKADCYFYIQLGQKYEF